MHKLKSVKIKISIIVLFILLLTITLFLLFFHNNKNKIIKNKILINSNELSASRMVNNLTFSGFALSGHKGNLNAYIYVENKYENPTNKVYMEIVLYNINSEELDTRSFIVDSIAGNESTTIEINYDDFEKYDDVYDYQVSLISDDPEIFVNNSINMGHIQGDFKISDCGVNEDNSFYGKFTNISKNNYAVVKFTLKFLDEEDNVGYEMPITLENVEANGTYDILNSATESLNNYVDYYIADIETTK